MKKRSIIFMALCALVLLTGCGEKKDPVKENLEVFQKVFDKNKEVKSGEVVVTLDVAAKTEGVDVQLNVPVKVAFNEVDNATAAKLEIGDNPLIGEVEAYLNVVKENLKIYIPSTVIDSIMGQESDETNWFLLETTLDEMTDDTDVNEITENLSKIDLKSVIKEENLKLIDTTDDINHYKFVINRGLIERLATALEEDISDLEFEDNASFEFDVYVNVKTNEVTKINMDLLDIAKDTESGDMFSKFNISIEFKNLNNTEIKIPSDVISNAIKFDLSDTE